MNLLASGLMFWKRGKLPPLAHGERDLWVSVCVDLPAPVPFEGDPGAPMVVGYFQGFGLRIRGEEVQRHMQGLVADGRIDWSDSRWRAVAVEDLEKDVRRGITAPDDAGVWYRGGKMYFPVKEGAP
jgi:hypothetical protein